MQERVGEEQTKQKSHKNIVEKKKTFSNRQKELEQMDKEGVPMMSSMLMDWPCFQQGEYVSKIYMA